MSDVMTWTDEGEKYVSQMLKERFESGDVKIYCMNVTGFSNPGGITFATLTSNVHVLVYSDDPPEVSDPEILDGETAFGYSVLSVTRWRAKNNGGSPVVGLGWVGVDESRGSVLFVTPFSSVFGMGAGDTIDVTMTIRIRDESQA